MAEVLFYHLEHATMEQVLPGLLERTLSRGWNAVLKVGQSELVDPIDAHLWTYRDDSFLPHGKGPFDPRQPVWITSTDELPEGRDVLFLVAGAHVPVTAHQNFTRSVLLFDETGAPSAREAWKEIKAEGLDATYWRQSPAGKWEKAA